MSHKFELQEKIAELEKKVDSNKAELNRLYRELSSISMKERIDAYTAEKTQQLLKG